MTAVTTSSTSISPSCATLTLFERRAPGTSTREVPVRDFPPARDCSASRRSKRSCSWSRGLNARCGRTVGVYPEIKDPEWHRRHGIDLARLVLGELRAFGYSRPAGSGVRAVLRRRRAACGSRTELGCELRLIQLVGPEAEHAELTTTEGLRRVAAYACGLGPHYSQLLEGHGLAPAARLRIGRPRA